jgi:DNA-binding NtrC family response regulator
MRLTSADAAMNCQPRVLLLVEDHEGTRNVLRSIFTRRGWSVLTASTVAEGLALLDHDPRPGFLILDLMLPDGEGEAVLKKVRRLNLSTCVAITSGMCDPVRLGAVSAMKPEAVLQKPIDLDGLFQVFESAMIA